MLNSVIDDSVSLKTHNKMVCNILEVNCMVENKCCILITDDEPKMVRAMRDFFVANGFLCWKLRMVWRY